MSMSSLLKPGDLAISTAGRDKGRIFLITEIDKEFVFIVDGKLRKVGNPKKKNKKHLKKVLTDGLIDLSARIQKGECVGNERICRAIKTQTKKQED